MYGAMDAGASQFGGGFFQASQNNDASAPSPAAKNQNNNRREGMRAVTIKMLLDASMAQYMDENQAFQEVTNVGKIVGMRAMPGGGGNNCVDFQLHDATGAIQILYYPDEGEEEAQKAAELQVGTYVRVHGKFSEFNGAWRIQAFHVRPITDFNEVTYHNLQAIFQARHVAKGGPGTGNPLAEQNVAGPTAAAGGYAAPVGGGGNAMGGGGGDPNEIGNDGLNSIQRQVFTVLKRPEHFANSAGITVEQIASECPTLTMQQVSDAAAVLVEDGRVYTASDEYHFRACDSA